MIYLQLREQATIVFLCIRSYFQKYELQCVPDSETVGDSLTHRLIKQHKYA